jgi:DNA replication protein DnaC
MTNSFRYHTSQEIIDNVNVNGVSYLNEFGTAYQNVPTIYVDDIASTGETINYFGTKINVMEQLISMRYNVYCSTRKLTHVSSNRYPNELKELYGERIVDRNERDV